MILIFCILQQTSCRHPNLDPHLHLAVMSQLQLKFSYCQILFPCRSYCIFTPLPPTLCFLFFAVPDSHTRRSPWLTVRRAETCHSSSYQRARGPSSLCLPLPPPTPPPLPPSLDPLLWSSQWARVDLTAAHQLHRKIKKASIQFGMLPPSSWVGCIKWKYKTDLLSSAERTSHAFPFGADAAGAVGRCLPGSHAALSSRVGPLRRVQVPGLLWWRPDLGLYGLSARGSRHDPVPEGHPGSPKHHLRRPSRDVLCPGEYLNVENTHISIPKMLH